MAAGGGGRTGAAWKSPSSTIMTLRSDLRETLLAIREFLYMLDIYSGHL